MPDETPDNNIEPLLESILVHGDRTASETNQLLEHTLEQEVRNGTTLDHSLELQGRMNDNLSKVAEALTMPQEEGTQSYFIKTLKGDKGDKGDTGDTRTDEEVMALIAPLIPAPIPGRDGMNAPEINQEALIEAMLGRVTMPKDGRNGKDGADGKDGSQGIAGTNGKDGSPDTGADIKSKLEGLEVGSRLDYTKLDNLPNLDEIFEKARRGGKHVASKTVSLKELDDVDLTGLQVNAEGKYILGSGSGGGAVWGSITGTITDQADLISLLNGYALNTGWTPNESIFADNSGNLAQDTAYRYERIGDVPILSALENVIIFNETFTGSGLDDLTPSGAYTGEHTDVIIIGLNGQDYVEYSVGINAFSDADSVIGMTSGSTGIVSKDLAQYGFSGNVFFDMTSGNFIPGELIVAISYGSVSFSGSGLNDMTYNMAGFTGSGTDSILVTIDSVGTPDTFEWRLNGVLQATGVSIAAGVPIPLVDGIEILFPNDTGHDLGNLWSFIVNPTASGIVNTQTTVSSDYFIWNTESLPFTLEAITGSTQSLADGLDIAFGQIDSHTLLDQWLFENVPSIRGTVNSKTFNGAALQLQSEDGIGTQSFTLKAAPSMFSDLTLFAPIEDGHANYVMTTDGASQLGFQSINSLLSGVPYEIYFADGSGNLSQSPNFLFDPNTIQFRVGDLSQSVNSTEFIVDDIAQVIGAYSPNGYFYAGNISGMGALFGVDNAHQILFGKVEDADFRGDLTIDLTQSKLEFHDILNNREGGFAVSNTLAGISFVDNNASIAAQSLYSTSQILTQWTDGTIFAQTTWEPNGISQQYTDGTISTNLHMGYSSKSKLDWLTSTTYAQTYVSGDRVQSQFSDTTTPIATYNIQNANKSELGYENSSDGTQSYVRADGASAILQRQASGSASYSYIEAGDSFARMYYDNFMGSNSRIDVGSGVTQIFSTDSVATTLFNVASGSMVLDTQDGFGNESYLYVDPDNSYSTVSNGTEISGYEINAAVFESSYIGPTTESYSRQDSGQSRLTWLNPGAGYTGVVSAENGVSFISGAQGSNQGQHYGGPSGTGSIWSDGTSSASTILDGAGNYWRGMYRDLSGGNDFTSSLQMNGASAVINVLDAAHPTISPYVGVSNSGGAASTEISVSNGSIFAAAVARSAGYVEVYGRFEQHKGTNTAAANNLTLPLDGNLFVISGNTQINAITTSNWVAGSHITLIFTGIPTVKHNTAGGAGTARIFLAGSTDLIVLTANTLLGLVYDGTQWQETYRKVG